MPKLRRSSILAFDDGVAHASAPPSGRVKQLRRMKAEHRDVAEVADAAVVDTRADGVQRRDVNDLQTVAIGDTLPGRQRRTELP